MSLSVKLIVIFLLLSIVPLSTVGFLAYVSGRQAIEQDMLDRLMTTTLLKEAEFEQWVNYSIEDIETLAQRPLVREYAATLVSHSPTAPEYQAAYNRIYQDHFLPRLEPQDNFLDFSLIRASDGLIMVSTQAGLEGKYYSGESFFIEGQKDIFVDDIRYLDEEAELVMHISTPVTDVNGLVVAVLTGHLDLARISDIMTRRSGLRASEETYMVNASNRMITGSLFNPDSVLNQVVNTQGVADCLLQHNGTGFYNDYRDVPVLGAYQWMADRSLCIVTEIDQREVLVPIVQLGESILLVGVVIGLGAALTGFSFAKTITTPISHLVHGTEQIARGNLDYWVGTPAKDEIGQLSRAFDQMSGELKSTTVSRDALAQEVVERKQAEERARRYAGRLAAINRLDRIISSGLEITTIYDSFVQELQALILLDRTAIVLLNEAGDQWQVSRQWTRHEPAVEPDIWRPVAGSIIEWMMTNRQPFFESEIGEKGDWPETEILRREGIHSRLLLPMIIQGRVIGLLTFASSQPDALSEEDQSTLVAIADQLAIAIENSRLYAEVKRHAAELEARVAERTAQLEVSNKELEAFSYSVSHDLRAPLRAMDGFSRILQDEYAPDLPDEAQRYLKLVRDNAQQMGNLIDHLLAFSRLGRREIQKEWVNPAQLVQEVLDELTAAQPERDIEVTIGDLPLCQADPALLRQVFANLLDNALKYTKTRNHAIIDIGYSNQDGDTVFFVKDNGVGFDMQYANKLFGVFQRLHRAEEYEGNGVGLATVQRIIHRHGGRIWAESAVDKGAVFYFTL